MTIRTRVGDSASNVAFFAFRDGDGAWQAVEGLGGRYDVVRTSDRFGVAWVCGVNAYGSEYVNVGVVFATAADGFPGTLYCDAEQWTAVGGTVDGLGPNDSANVYFRSSGDGVNDNNPDVEDTEAPDMTQDVVIVRQVDGDVHDVQIERAYHPGTSFFISFADGGVEPEEVETLDTGTYSSQLHTANGTYAFIGRSNNSLWRIPESELEYGDLHEFLNDGPDGWHSYFTHAGEAVELPPPTASLVALIEVVESGPHARFAVDVDYGEVPPDQVLAYHLSASQYDDDDESYRHWDVYATEAWLDGASVFETPGFGDLDGWNDQWSLREGSPALTYADAWSSSTDLGLVVRSVGGAARYLADEDDGAHKIHILGVGDEITP